MDGEDQPPHKCLKSEMDTPLVHAQDHRTKVGLPSHSTLPKPLLEASVMTDCAPSFCALCLGSCLALVRRGPSNGPGLIHSPSHRYAVASVTPGRGWNPLLQPELDGLHVKQTQLKYRRSRCHKAQHSLESFERTGGTFLEGGHVVLNFNGSLS